MYESSTKCVYFFAFKISKTLYETGNNLVISMNSETLSSSLVQSLDLLLVLPLTLSSSGSKQILHGSLRNG